MRSLPPDQIEEDPRNTACLNTTFDNISRDIKPTNVLIRKADSRLVVVDFGTVFVMDVSLPRISLEGYTMGTPLYMAPEQFTKPTSDPSTDIYSFGAVMYFLLAGHPPHFVTGEDNGLPGVLARRVAKNRPLDFDFPEAPSGFIELVRKCLAFHAEERPSARECVQELQRVLVERVVGWSGSDEAEWSSKKEPQKESKPRDTAKHRPPASLASTPLLPRSQPPLPSIASKPRRSSETRLAWLLGGLAAVLSVAVLLLLAR